MKTVYSIFDMQELEHHMFATDSEVLAKDAVMAFLEKIKGNVFASSDPQSQALNDETFKSLQSLISATTSIEELSEALVGYDFRLATLQVD
ncbi:hypothetical protein Mangalitsa_044 [Escherichia phage Mangalitsa]|uniref:Uncharacterized protein n=1 Tax=Escherichia phage Mangalitsa TaxID=2589658 RepID=A0A5B9N5K9_9CAUD|nr:hypothetical protein HWC55_gp44 [Escherichia phage Mangalitsa]QEG07846.1 hypothetical protein Mangalitsa_044 [Escherichia phage Mangalitsa]